jgi:hypothetical protein
VLAELTRRDFLKASSATTAVCVLPLPTIPEPLVVVWQTGIFDYGHQIAVSITVPPSIAARIGGARLGIRKLMHGPVKEISKEDELELKAMLLEIVQLKLGHA